MNKLQKLITSDKELAFVCKYLTIAPDGQTEFTEKERELLVHIKRVKENTTQVDIYDQLLTKADRSLYGKFFSPKWLGHLCARLGVDESTSSIYDITCGSGCLVMEAFKYAKEIGAPISKIWGNDIDTGSLEIFKSNFIQYKSENLKIYCTNYDATKPINIKTKWDLCVLNPPFSIPWSREDHEIYGGLLAPKQRADWALIQQAFYHCKKLVAITPNGVWTRMGAEAKIRRSFLEKNQIEAIIFMPASLFVCTGINTCIAVFNKNKVDNTITLVNAENFYSKGTVTSNTLSIQQSEELIKVLKEKKSDNPKIIVQVKSIEDFDENCEFKKPHPPEPKQERSTIEEMRRNYLDILECQVRCNELKKQLNEQYEQDLKEWEKWEKQSKKE